MCIYYLIKILAIVRFKENKNKKSCSESCSSSICWGCVQNWESKINDDDDNDNTCSKSKVRSGFQLCLCMHNGCSVCLTVCVCLIVCEDSYA